MSRIREAVANFFEDRLSISKVREFASHKTVPVHRYSVFYYLGGMTLFFFIVQVITGILLMLYYRPSADGAFESIEFIMTVVPFGWLIRSLHSWSANLMVFFAFVHLVTAFFMKAYRAPRELTWITGCITLFLLMGFGFSGYLLPWNQLAFFATKVGTDIAGAVPFVGHFILRFLRGGDRVTGGTLSRFYGWHVAILPAIATVLISGHLLLVQIKGMSVPPKVAEEAKRRKPTPFFPHFAMRDLFGWVLALGVLAALAALFPWELGEKADAFAPAYENIRPEWYFVFMFQTLKLVPGGEIFGLEYEAIPILLFGLGGALLVAVPFLDRRINRDGKSPLFTAIGIAVLLFMIGMTVWGYASLTPIYVVLGTIALIAFFAYVTRNEPDREGKASDSAPVAQQGATMVLMIALIFIFAPRLSAAPAKTSCESCHTNKDMFDAQAIGRFSHISSDIHLRSGLGCHDCHGGNPDPKLAEDMTGAMDPGFKTNPYVGAPARQDIPEFCGKCHSSLPYMRKFQPTARVDQVAEYWTSRHGKGLKSGDTRVATCIDCHGVHGILAVGDENSPVYPTHVAETCSRCHSDANRMAGYKDDYGHALPVNQYALWRRSVHAAAMFEKDDLTAPTCNDCHGNHGATPPGVDSVGFVCGNCHGREAELFRASTKHQKFADHNELLATSKGGCPDCHEGASFARVAETTPRFSECVTCHGNHGVIRPTIAMLGPLPGIPCAFCHEGTGPLAATYVEPQKKLQHYTEVRDRLLGEAGQLKLDGDARFDWLVDQALKLDTHVIRGSAPGAKPTLRPEFARLFEKFRIGKTYYTYNDPTTKKDVRVSIRRCVDCHDPTATDSEGAKVAREFLDRTRQLTGATARAERIILAAQRGGVETRSAKEALDSAVDSQIESEVLVHTFATKGQFDEKNKEGLKFAEQALRDGQHSLGELGYRRKGLTFALGIIALVLLGLGFKIRDLSNRS